MTTWIQTYTGRRFDLLEPRMADVDIRDIAHALSQQCRFNGHCRQFYSVAEHSVRVAALLPPELELCGLMHDAAEAYVGDMVSPLKDRLISFVSIEHEIMKVLAGIFYFEWPMPEEVKMSDERLCVTEGRDLMGGTEGWGIDAVALDETIRPWCAEVAELRFLSAHERFLH